MLRRNKLTAVVMAAVFAAMLLPGCGKQSNKEAVPVTSPGGGETSAMAQTQGNEKNTAASVDVSSGIVSGSTDAEQGDMGSGIGAADAQSGSAEAGSSEGEKAAKTAAVSKDGKKLTPLEHYYQGGDFWDGCPERNVQLLTPNEYSRPQIPIEEVRDIVIHFVDEPGSTAMQNRDYFESLKDGSGRSVSSHFIINLDGEIVQCVPLDEVAYASNNRNKDSISIENCHPDSTGKFTDDTYLSCVDLAAWLCYAFQITPDHVIRHYDITGKDCPRYYVEHEDAWLQMKEEIAERYYEYEETYGKRRPD